MLEPRREDETGESETSFEKTREEKTKTKLDDSKTGNCGTRKGWCLDCKELDSSGLSFA